MTIDNELIYYGVFHPVFLSSTIFGVATITPAPSLKKKLRIDFWLMERSDFLKALDKRNDSKIISALVKTNRVASHH